MNDEAVCVCTHRRDEHAEGFLAECEVVGCDCDDFELYRQFPWAAKEDIMDDRVCECGHILDKHDSATIFVKCQVENCGCSSFECEGVCGV